MQPSACKEIEDCFKRRGWDSAPAESMWMMVPMDKIRKLRSVSTKSLPVSRYSTCLDLLLLNKLALKDTTCTFKLASVSSRVPEAAFSETFSMISTRASGTNSHCV